jgi:NAD(P)-dependent dehydrogenase (short-subunit alcohol dehydrogenase family)
MPGKKTAIITGASGGIGAGLVDGFLREGYNVVGMCCKKPAGTLHLLCLTDG